MGRADGPLGAPALVMAATVVALFVLSRLVEVLELIAIAMLVALVLRQVANGLCRFGLRPWVSVLLLFGAFAAVGFLVWTVVVPDVIRETQQLLSRAPRELGEAAARSRREQGLFRLLPDLRQMVDGLQGYIARLDSRLPQLLQRVGRYSSTPWPRRSWRCFWPWTRARWSGASCGWCR